MTAPTDAFEAAIQIARSLDRRSIPYALGGAHAYGQYAIPRATNDVDVNVFVEPRDLAQAFEALTDAGAELDPVKARGEAEDTGLFVARIGQFRLDVFTPSIDFSWEAARTRVAHDVEGEPVWFLAPEALCVFKLLFFRGKDVVDLERLIAVQGDHLDQAYVRARIVEMMGEEDPRVVTWDRLWGEHRPE